MQFHLLLTSDMVSAFSFKLSEEFFVLFVGRWDGGLALSVFLLAFSDFRLGWRIDHLQLSFEILYRRTW